MREKEVLVPRHQLLKEKLEGKSIRTAAIDGDDTLWETRYEFMIAIDEVSEMLGVDSSEFTVVMDSLRAEFGVNPVIMDLVVTTLAKLQGMDVNSDTVENALDRAYAIYEDITPGVMPGAIKMVNDFNKATERTILATISNRDWAERKIMETGFAGKFADWVIFSVHKPKSVQWEKQMGSLNINWEELIVVGDNPHSDILPTVEKGAAAVWITNGRRKVFSGEEDLPIEDLYSHPRVKIVERTSEVVDAIINW